MPAIFQRLMNTALAVLTWTHCLVYIEDCIIFGRTFEEHLERLVLVLQRLQQANITLNIITADGIRPNPAKTSAVQTFEVPTSVTGTVIFGFDRLVPQIHPTVRRDRSTIVGTDQEEDSLCLGAGTTESISNATTSLGDTSIVDLSRSCTAICFDV